MKAGEVKITARVSVTVDAVDVEQEKIERKSPRLTERDLAVHAANANPDIAGLRKLAGRNNLPITVKAARRIAPSGSWKVIFLIGKKEKDNDRLEAGDIF